MIKIIIGLNLITSLLSNNVGIATSEHQINFADGTGYYIEEKSLNVNEIYFVLD